MPVLTACFEKSYLAEIQCPIETSTLLPISINAVIFRGENQSCAVFSCVSCSAADAQPDAGAAPLM